MAKHLAFAQAMRRAIGRPGDPALAHVLRALLPFVADERRDAEGKVPLGFNGGSERQTSQQALALCISPDFSIVPIVSKSGLHLVPTPNETSRGASTQYGIVESATSMGEHQSQNQHFT